VKNFILILNLFSLTFTSTALADLHVVIGRGSYMGEKHYGINYTSENLKHSTDLTYGNTEGVLGPDLDQINIKYVYSPFNPITIDQLQIDPIKIGGILSSWQSSNAYINSYQQYPEDDYYPANKFRGSLVLTHSWSYKNLQIYIDWVMLDQVAIALYNNSKYIDRHNIWAGGFGLRWKI